MTVLGLGAHGDAGTNVRVGFRQGIFRHISLVLSGAGGTAVVLSGYELLEHQPDKSFALLQAWGPWFLIALLAIITVGGILTGFGNLLRDGFSMMAESVKQSAEASTRTADALTRLADQGGRQYEEVQRLAIYAAREFPNVYERFDRQDEVLRDLTASIQQLHAKLTDGG
ncbi:hypothetical protein H7849_11855 [Alloacidobacterium dinghuense]|uniref:Uncharacterized protein n=1 Tax=Alloacidobacterium dinghuense TaxID=2763107 RepID=A0A7G8BPQ0_9BACT|nr:hypothetical protein [Alloacidobacterium dinghuense]QNI34520.1 hypothetical protein H7849_11855 [Alloacidobacterium dinghuense]